MTGLEKMKSQILDEAGKAADVKVAEAKAQAEELIQAARTEAAREAESISRKSEAEVANYKERAASSMDLQKRSRILEAKQAVIAEVLDKAYEKVSTMEKDEYFSMLLKLQNVMGRMRAKGSKNAALIAALKPLLSEKSQKKRNTLSVQQDLADSQMCHQISFGLHLKVKATME